MPTITLLRHGQASFGAADYDDLSDLGREQARLAGRTLATRGLRDPLWVHGSLRRQRDTAVEAMAAGGFGGRPAEDARFDEYDHVAMVQQRMPDGRAPGDPADFQAILDDALRDWVVADHPDGWGAFADGVRGALRDLAAELPAGRDAVVATSGGVIAAICAGLVSGGPDTVVSLNRVVVNVGFTTLLVGRSGLSLLSFNDHAHLTGADAGLRTYR